MFNHLQPPTLIPIPERVLVIGVASQENVEKLMFNQGLGREVVVSDIDGGSQGQYGGTPYPAVRKAIGFIPPDSSVVVREPATGLHLVEPGSVLGRRGYADRIDGCGLPEGRIDWVQSRRVVAGREGERGDKREYGFHASKICRSLGSRNDTNCATAPKTPIKPSKLAGSQVNHKTFGE